MELHEDFDRVEQAFNINIAPLVGMMLLVGSAAVIVKLALWAIRTFY